MDQYLPQDKVMAYDRMNENNKREELNCQKIN